jgi:hypothetical protein
MLALGPLAAASAGNAPAVAAIEVHKGDEWQYVARDAVTGNMTATTDIVVTAVDRNEIDVRVQTRDPRTFAESTFGSAFDRRWRKRMDSGGTDFSGFQDSWGVPEKLEVGTSWEYHYEFRPEGFPMTARIVGHGEVSGKELIVADNDVSYDCYRIEYNEASALALANGRFEVRVTVWFAPEVNRYVRRDVEVRQGSLLVQSTIETLSDYVRNDSDR